MARKDGHVNSQILGYIKEYLKAHKRPPTIREIQAACEISSTSLVAYRLKQLEEQGLIEIDRMIARGIRLPGGSE